MPENSDNQSRESLRSELDDIIAATGRTREHIIPILQKIEERYNYLPESALRIMSEITELTSAEIISAASFYPQFRSKPSGRHFIQVCIGTACHVKGASGITKAFREHLGIVDGSDTDDERLFTVEEVACLGCCMLAPAVRIGDIIYGYLTPEKVPDVIADFLREISAEASVTSAGESCDTDGEVRLCLCSSCLAGGSGKVESALKECIRKFSLPVSLKRVACSGISFETPLLDITDQNGSLFRYGNVKPEAVSGILMHHFRPVSVKAHIHSKVFRLLENMLLNSTAPEPMMRHLADFRDDPHDYCKCQKRIVTEHSAEISPLDIDEYIASGGFEAWEAVSEKSGDEIIEEIKRSGLRGRGGGGFPVWKKWQSVRDAASDGSKILICNGDEGDPGAFMDRMILESFPFRVIEGMMIAAVAVNASEGIFYIRSEYPLAIRNINKAIKICEDRRFLVPYTKNKTGSRVSAPGSSSGFSLRVVEGAGAFVCGEETALIAALEGGRGIPRLRPPYPSEKGFRNLPTLINNVETFAAVPWICSNGSAKFAELGTPGSHGTKAFALAGKIRRGGLIEVPMGMTLNQIIFDIGGGIPGDKEVKAVQIGGPSGGCLPVSMFDTPIDYEELRDTGAIMGSGGLVVLDEDDCMVDIAKYFLSFVQKESCGKCTFCRVGTRRMLEIIEAVSAGQATEGDLEQLIELAEKVQKGSICGLGRTASNPLLSSIKYFRDEFDAHIAGRCPAGKCTELIRYFITTDCIGCTICAQNCPVDAIKTVPHKRHEIETGKCIKCGVCFKGCPVGAVKRK